MILRPSEFYAVQIDRIAFLAACLAEEFVKTHEAPCSVEAAHGNIVLEVGHADQLFHALALDIVHIILALDLEFLLVRFIYNSLFRRFKGYIGDLLQKLPHGFHERTSAFSGKRADGIEVIAFLLDGLLQLFQLLRIIDEVGLIRCDDLLLLTKLRAVQLELIINDMEIIQWISAFAARRIKHMDEDLRTLYMAEKFVPKTGPLTCAFDQTRDICHDEASLIVQIHHTEDRIQRREMVRRHFRLRTGYLADERGFPYARESQKTDIRQHLQLEAQLLFFTRLAFFRIKRRTDSRCREMGISAAAMPTFDDEGFLSILRHIRQKFAGLIVIDHRSERHLDEDVLCIFAEHLFGAAVGTGFGSEFSMTAEIDQRIQVAIRFDEDRAALAAITARRAAARYILLTAEGNHPVPARTGDYNNLCSIDKHGVPRLRNRRNTQEPGCDTRIPYSPLSPGAPHAFHLYIKILFYYTAKWRFCHPNATV